MATKTTTQVTKKITYNFLLGQKHMQFRQPNVMDNFISEPAFCAGSGKEAICITNPLQMMLNQKRIESLGNLSVKEWLEAFSLQPQSELNKLRKQCSDDDLCSMIKSRHLQSPAEVLAWSRKMASNMDKFNSEVQKHIEAMQVQQQTDSTEQTNVE